MVTISKLEKATEKELIEIVALISQLRHDVSEHVGALSDLEDIVSNKDVAMLVAKDEDKIIGMATLYVMTKVGKRVSNVEDVVVSDAYRGQGLGEKLMQALIEEARKRKVKSLSLTTKPDRVAANKLYQKLGFKAANTNSYKLNL